MRYFWIFVPFIINCNNFIEKENQKEAINIVWNGIYQSKNIPPSIDWREDFCNSKYPNIAGVSIEGECYAGFTESEDLIIIAWRGDFEKSAFSHELLHVFQYNEGISDAGHSRAKWGLGFNHPYGLLDLANDALKNNNY